MLVSHKKRFIFLKTSKTAGTSVEVALQPFCTPPGQVPANFTAPIISEYGIVGRRGERIQSDKYYNHINALEFNQLLGDEIWNSYLKLCTIRNPFDITVSMFWFRLSRDQRDQFGACDFAVVREAFSQWLPTAKLPTGQGNFCIAGQPALDRYLRFESFDTDLEALARELDLPSLELPTLKSGHRRHKDHSFREYFSADTAEIVKRAFENNFAWFDYSIDSWR